MGHISCSIHPRHYHRRRSPRPPSGGPERAWQRLNFQHLGHQPAVTSRPRVPTHIRSDVERGDLRRPQRRDLENQEAHKESRDGQRVSRSAPKSSRFVLSAVTVIIARISLTYGLANHVLIHQVPQFGLLDPIQEPLLLQLTDVTGIYRGKCI